MLSADLSCGVAGCANVSLTGRCTYVGFGETLSCSEAHNPECSLPGEFRNRKFLSLCSRECPPLGQGHFTSCHSHSLRGTAVAQWLRCCVTNQKLAGSIPAGVTGYFIDIKSFRSHYGPGVDSASNRNEYQEYFLGVKAAGA